MMTLIAGLLVQIVHEWWESGAEIWSPRTTEEHSMYYLNYVNIYYKGKEYRINPAFI